MNIKILKSKNRYYFLINEKKKILTPNGNLLEVPRKTHAEIIVKEINKQIQSKDPCSLVNLTYFSCNLSLDEKKRIKKKLIEILCFDIVLFRCFEDEELEKLINKKLNPFMDKFEKKFKLNLTFIYSIVISPKFKSRNFNNYLNKLDNYQLTVLFKLATLTNSVILSYFFLIKEISYNALFKLTNLEYNYQQKRWGVVSEQIQIEKNYYESLKKISFFFKNIN
jgi:chaperone required for assembly of F1-ATPase